MFLGSIVRPVRRADNLTAIVSLLSRQCGILNISQPYRPPQPVTGIVLLYFTYPVCGIRSSVPVAASTLDTGFQLSPSRALVPADVECLASAANSVSILCTLPGGSCGSHCHQAIGWWDD
jgi:hypothetical protein